MNKIEFQIDGKTIEVTPNFDFIDRVETRIDMMSFMASVEKGRPKLSDVAWVLTSAIKSTGRDADYNLVGEEVVKDWGNMLNKAAQLLAAILTGGPSKKPEPPEVPIQG